jgi:gliding motility-associated-like protein
MKKLTSTILKRVLVLIAFTLTNYSFASDLYWVNGSGSWDDSQHWSNTSGGTSSGQIPSSQDNVIFDQNSFGSEMPIVYVNSNIAVNDLLLKDNVYLYSTLNNITVQGDFIASSTFNVHLNSLIFDNNTSSTNTINTNDKDVNSDIIFQNGSWELAASLKTSITNNISFIDGEFASNGHSVFAENIYAIESSINFNLTNSVVYAVNEININKAKDKGAAADFYVGGPAMTQAQKGGFGNSSSNFTKDQTTLCSDGNLTIDIVTIDYAGGWNVTCNDTCDGEITVIPSGTPGPYAIKFDLGLFTSQTVYPDLCTGNYSITVRDSSNELGTPGSGIYYQCSVFESILEPPVLLLDILSVTQPTCPTTCDGQALTIAGGGTAPIVVTWINSAEVTESPTGLCTGVNPVQLVDDNNCVLDTFVTIVNPPAISEVLTITEPTCNSDCDAEVSVAAGGGNGGPYTFSWSVVPTSGQGTNPGVGFCAGVVTLSTFDVDNCQHDTTFTINEPPVLSITANFVADASCFAVCDGQASSTPVGGAGNNTFEWFTCLGVSTGITDQNPTTLCAGDYYVVVTDDNGAGCTAQSACITIDEPIEIDAVAQVYQMSCFGVCDGAVDVDATGGVLPYTYSWVTVPGGAGVGAVDSLSGLCAGLYEITVTDANLCNSIPDTVEVIEPTPVTVSIVGTDPTCYDLCDGSAIATPGGGTPPYNFSWAPAPGAGQGTATPSAMCAGTYDLTLTDSEGCPEVDQVILNNPPQYDISAVQTDLQCAGDANGTIDVTINSGGSGAGYTFLWAPVPPVGQGTANVSGLTAGMWCVTISDDMACDTTICYTIIEPPVLTATASVISQVSCFGDCDGSAQVVINGGTGPYSTLWTPTAQVTLVASSLCAGAYTVDVTDDNGCTANDGVNIIEPAQFDLTVSQTDITCFGDCVGTATITVNSGGTPAYNYLWDDAPVFQTTPTAINLCAGNYTVTVTDQNLCDTIVPFTIIEPAEIVIDTNVINSACFGSCSGEANVAVVGGTGAYTYEWYDVLTGLPLGVNNSTITGLCPGQYYAEVTDAALCVVLSDTMTITELPEILTSVVSTTDAACGACDGLAEVLATGGTGVFTYTWTPAPGVGQGTASVSGLCAGAFNVVATDDAGCTANIAVNINSVALEVTTMDSTDLTCFGVCNGTATVNFNSLIPNYTVEWFDNITGIPLGIVDGPGPITTSTATGLCAGQYLAVVTNGGGCVFSDTITVNEPPEITGTISQTDVTCNGLCDGTASVVASGGTGALTYNWAPMPGSGQGTPNAGGLCAGNWTVTVTDAQLCSVPFPTTVAEPVVMVIDNETSTDITCFGADDGTATILHSGGIGPYTYEWFDCLTGFPIGQTTQSATALPPGDYQVVVTDFNGCTVTSSCLPVVEPPEITGNLNVSPVNCYGLCDGMLDIVAGGGTAPYFYQWQDDLFVDLPGQTNDTLNNVCQGFYNVVVTDFNGCSVTFGPVDMSAPTNPWNVTESQTNISCSGSCDGTATVAVLAGNNPPYTYQWDDAPIFQTTTTATNLCAGIYNVTISDASICDTVITFTIVEANPIFANAAITNVLCFGDCTGEITLAPSGGTGPYTVTWSDLQIGNTASNLCSGFITATITDASGCVKDTIIEITEPAELIANSTFSNNPTCGVCNGSATVNVAGGVPIYTYNWTPAPVAGQGTNNATGLCSGIISVDVTDQNGCVLTEIFNLSDVNAEVLTMDSTDVSCFGVCDGAVEVIYTCNDPGCTNQWYDGITGLAIPGATGLTMTGLCAQDYYVEVTNASGCVAVGLTTVTGPTQIIANEVITPITCNSADDATITLAPTGGSGAGYTYTWSPVPTNGQGTNQALNIGGGIWCVDIQDGDGCIENVCFNLSEPTPIVITPTVTEPACSGDCNGIVSIAVTGGYGSYTYQWYDGGGAPIGGNTTLISGLCAGNYSVDVTDIGGCTVNLPLTLSEPSLVTGPITGTDVLCFGDCTGTASVTPAGGFPPYIVNWYNSISGLLIGQTGNTATALCPDDYHAVITDNNGCSSITPSVTVGEPLELTWSITSNDATCFGVCDGDATITPVGGTPAYTYEWLDVTATPVVGGTNPGVVNLCAGSYTVQVTDLNGCTSGQQPVVINEYPEITANVFSNDATCGASDGNATVFALGGNPPLSYQWTDNLLVPIGGATSSVSPNLPAGTYFVIVTDISGCSATFQADISNIPTTTLTWDAVNHPTCFGAADGSLEITTTAVSPPLSYTWNPGGIITEDPTGLTAGLWTLQITDALGCINFYDTTLVDPAEIIITPTVTPSDCGLCNGEIDLVVAGGTGTLTTIWNNGMNGSPITGLCSSTYQAQVTDQNGCQVIESIDVPNNAGLTATAAITAITCANACDGSVLVTGVGGTPPYSFLWLHDNSTSDTQSGLCAGSYFVQATDASGCIYSLEVVMADPAPIEATEVIVNPSCGLADGSITVTSSGGILPHTYSWDTGPIVSAITNLNAGVYTLTITDAAGCTMDFVYPLSNSDAPIAVLTSTDLLCNGVCDGQIDTTSVTGGTPGYTFEWLDGNGATLGITTPLITALCAGDYTLQTTDNLACVSFETITITEPDTILLNPLFAVNPACAGICDGQLVSNPIGGTLPFTFLWDDADAQTTITADSLCDGTYNLTVTDANGCTSSQSGAVVEPPIITVVTDSIVDATCWNSDDGGIYITVSGGTPGYTVEWISEDLADTLTVEDPVNLYPMDYYLTITDTNGCVLMDTMSVDTLISVLAFVGNDTTVCLGDSAYLYGYSNIDPLASLTWWDTTFATGFGTTNTMAVPTDAPGVFMYILVANYLGCSHADTVVVTVVEAAAVDAGPDVEMFAQQTELIGGNPTSSGTNDTYNWSPSDFLTDSTSANPSIVKPTDGGFYFVTVTDSNGCTAIDSMELILRPDIVIPDGISPDGNGLNETWILDFIDLYPSVSISINVYNRWGEPLFTADETYQDDWGGTTAKGKRLPAGTYYYTIDIDHPDFPEPFTGPITIMW